MLKRAGPVQLSATGRVMQRPPTGQDARLSRALHGRVPPRTAQELDQYLKESDPSLHPDQRMKLALKYGPLPSVPEEASLPRNSGRWVRWASAA